MGASCNVQRKPQKSNTHKLIAQRFALKFEQFELSMLIQIYRDLASRSSSTQLTREAFNSFFQTIGFWGEQIFNKFTYKHEDSMNFEEFLSGLELYIKSPEDKKVLNLFQLYDLHNQNVIAKCDFLQMMQNYPQSELKKICEDQLFLDESHITNEFGKSKQILKHKKNSIDIMEMSMNHRKASQNMNEQQFESSHKISEGLQSNFSKQSDALFVQQDSMIQENGLPQKRFGLNIVAQIDGKQQEMCINQNQLIKKYVDLVYKNKHEQQLSLQDFQNFITKHPNLISPLYAAFNYDIWGEINSQPRYKTLQPSMIGELFRINKKQQVKGRYCELYKDVLMEFKKKNDKEPSKIICLSGLIIEERVDLQGQRYGFEILHTQQVYRSKEYRCSDEKSFKQWQNALQAYNNGEISTKYSVLERIGQGQSSTVYKCQQKTSKQLYALKIINKSDISINQEDAIKHEMNIMKLINHNNIVKLIDNVESRNHYYLVTELIKDGDLYDYVEEKKYLSEDEAAFIFSQLIDAVSHIHSMGIVHRDIKPENIMIILQSNIINKVKLIDFGFANYISILNERIDKFECGTMNYIAPEVYLQKKQITTKIDNFALGGVLYFMLCGYPPFNSDIILEIRQNVIEGNYDINDEFWQCVSDDAKELIAGLLDIDPNNRFTLQQVKEHKFIKLNLEKRKVKNKKMI